jgi:hypothetical protein
MAPYTHFFVTRTGRQRHARDQDLTLDTKRDYQLVAHGSLAEGVLFRYGTLSVSRL